MKPGTHQGRVDRRRRNRGTVLIVTMWVAVVLAGLALVFAQAARVEAIAGANQRATLQAEAVARGALQYVIQAVDGPAGRPGVLDNVTGEARRVGQGYFYLLKPSLSGNGTYEYGLIDEASRINLNTAASDMLLKLPGMTAELADSILDWRDENADVSPNGAESEYYLLLDHPYYCKDAPLEAVEEMLLIRGASKAILYGEDTNRNGVLDPNENDGDAGEPDDNRDGSLDRGLLGYVTVYSAEPNLSADGQPRVNVSSGGPALAGLLREVIRDDSVFTILDNARRGRPFSSVLDFYFRSGLTKDQFALVADRLTTSNADALSGLVNVNTAPREVLLCLPELGESDVDALIEHRTSPSVNLTSVAWVADVLPREKATAIGPYITTRSYQFAADIVAVSGDGRSFRRCRAVVDARQSPPRVLRWQDLTHLGWPLDPEILAALREGSSVGRANLTASLK